MRSIRHRLAGPWALRDAAMRSGATPATKAAAAAASRLLTWCSPINRERTGWAEPSGRCRVNSGLPPGPRRTPEACTRAAGTSGWVFSGDSPKNTTGAAVRACMRRTAGSSSLSTATPSAPRASTSSPLARAMFATPPNSPAWAEPTHSTIPMSGRTMRQR
ncbi:hypothetical protein AUQ48_13250 [Kocuria flava]|uniref:Uncharacterized protein n=1 Tax=Kocuria flava TaxID=446860 RepID=A0A2N4T489_9MICC|nr:hypothetical protein AUQ48_13250 [Kocuria flava]